MAGKRRSAAERSAIMAAYRQSGPSGQAFARREGLAPSTLYQWLTARSVASPAPPVRLARVVRRWADGPAVASVATARGSELIVEIGAARVRLGHDFDRVAFTAVLDILQARVASAAP